MTKILPLLAFAAGTLLAGASHAADDSACAKAAAEKKLAGAAKTSFLKKCEKDATASCDKAAAEKKLAGAAKNSFTKKCVAETGPAAS
jgi:hypothetical protein